MNGNNGVWRWNKKRRFYVVSILLLLVGLVLVLTLSEGFFEESSSKDVSGGAVLEGNRVPSVVKKTETGNLNAGELKETDVVKNLPKDATVALSLGGEYYTVKKGSVVAGKPSDSDITISLPAAYAPRISESLCGTVKKANQNGELAVEMHSSQAALIWKYRGMLKYRDCLS